MKVRKVWECECGSSSAFESTENSSLILRGNYFHTTQPVGGQSRVTCRDCSDHYETNPMVVRSKGTLKKTWQCRCEMTKLLTLGDGSLLITGPGHPMGHPHTRVRCTECNDKHRIARDVTHYSQLQSKARKRRRSRGRRR